MQKTEKKKTVNMYVHMCEFICMNSYVCTFHTSDQRDLYTTTISDLQIQHRLPSFWNAVTSYGIYYVCLFFHVATFALSSAIVQGQLSA